LNGFQLKASDAGAVLDTLTALSTKYATTAGGLSAALKQSAVSAQEEGVSYTDLAAMIAVASSVTQKSAETIGMSFTQMFSRMTSVAAGKSVDDLGDSINKVETTLTSMGIQLRDTQGQFAPLGTVLDEIASKWSTFDQVQQNEIATQVAGEYRRQNIQ
jgi:TP901 family phage tail tape measure protein